MTTSSADLTKFFIQLSLNQSKLNVVFRAIYQAIQTACQYACISIPKVLPATMQELSIKKELAKDMKISVNLRSFASIDFVEFDLLLVI